MGTVLNVSYNQTRGGAGTVGASTRPEKKDPVVISSGHASRLPGCFSSARITGMASRTLGLGSTYFIGFHASVILFSPSPSS